MSKTDPRIIFGVHSFTPYSLKTGLPYGSIDVLGGSTFALNGELEALNGGSTKFPWAVEETNIGAELSIKPKEYPDFLFELFLGKKPTLNGAEATGFVSALTDKVGTITDATTGCTVGAKAGSEDDIKFGKYVIKAMSATTVHVYAMTNIDFSRGTDADFQDDELRITESPLTIGNGTATEVPGFGIEITGGTAVAMTIDETGEFNSRPINNKSSQVIIGGVTDVYPSFGAIVLAQKRSSGEMFELDIFKLKSVGLPFNLEEKAFSEAEITAQAFYDASQKGVFGMTHITPTDC